MKGQWIGNYNGTNQGQIIIELDEQPNNYVGWAYLFDSTPGHPPSSAQVITHSKDVDQENEFLVGPVNVGIASVVSWQNEKEKYPGFIFPTKAKVKMKVDDQSLSLEWTTDIGTNGSAHLPRPKSNEPSEITPLEITTWSDFKQHVSTLPTRKYIFRGQERSLEWRLRTHFHRTGRADLKRLIYQDIPELHRATIHVTSHKFDLFDADERGAFYALVQHHGYPTPLLDWSYSPYVAAYFALSGLKKVDLDQNKSCRIFLFDRGQWDRDFNQLVDVAGVQPHFSVFSPMPLGNHRMSQQQALTTLTNVDDIESYIRNREQEKGKTYLEAIDLPNRERAEIMKDLEMMGITAASMFPGIDGACQYQKERFF